MSERDLVVVSAGLSQPSATRLLADRLATGAERAFRERGLDPRVEVIELREHARDLANNLVAGFASPTLQGSIDTVLAADGLIVVSPIFSASYSGLFKTFFDVLDRDALDGKPVLLAATAGTARHSLALDHAFRPLFAYLGAAVVPTGVFAAAEDWGEGDIDAEAPLAERIARAADELAVAVSARAPAGVTDPYEDPIPFERLLDRT